MSVVSNLYAAKVYSEHPLAVWPLDDDVSYISLITDTQRRFEASAPYVGWTVTNGTANDSLTLPEIGSPFNSNIYAGIQGSVPASSGTVIESKSPDLFLFNDTSQKLKTFSIGMYVYQSIYATEHEFGYEYYDATTASWIEVFSKVTALPVAGWLHLQDTFLIQEFDAYPCRIFFRSKVNVGGSAGDYNFILNGITVGQWSETTSSESLGATKQTAPASSGLSNSVVAADQYGVLSDYAYYVVESGSLLAKNEGIPMIFGSENVTKIFPSSDGTPSLIFPNKTMFTENGKHKNYTLEFWLKTRPSTKESRRILGPTDTTDGIYVTEGFITLVIDNKFVSHNVSNWYRPMIVHISIKNDTVSMLINGEQVGQILIDKKTISLSTGSWIGVYSYSDIDMMEIDCISISPYAIPLQLSRKRFVWGQGVDPLEIINNAFDGEEAVVNFSNSGYTANKVYPDMERWDAGHYNNMTATTGSLSVPEYSLPEIYLGGRDVDDWYQDNKSLNTLLYPSGNHPLFFTFRPNIESATWEPVNGTNWTEKSYLSFQNLTFLANPLSTMYGIFEVESLVATTRPLIHIENTLNGKRFEINITGYNVTYHFDGQELTGTGFTVANDHFVVGFNIPTISDSFNYELSSFFGAPENLTMFVGGNGTTTFEGKIYRIGFTDQQNFSEISEHFQSSGIANNADQSLIAQHYASYTLTPFSRYETYFLDISVSSDWEEYFPLSYFGSYVTQRDGSDYYDLDYLQFNIGYPSLIEIVATVVDNPDWVYQELFDAFNSPVQRSYEILDNVILSGYATYADLASNSITEYQIDTTQSSLDAYVTFQLLAEGADEPLKNFTNSKTLTDSYTVYANQENTSADPYKAYKTKFGVIDGTIIYPPKNINFNTVAMVVHLTAQQDGILSNPLKVKNLEITSRALNQNGLTPIGTKTGTPIYPYVRSGIYYDGKSQNPIMINKDNLPYLYVTENSGVKVLEQSQDREYGVLVPINNAKSEDYSLGAFQLFLKYDQFKEVETSQVVFKLIYQENIIEFVVDPDETRTRFKLLARDGNTKIESSGISFYQNGIKTVNPYLSKYEWSTVSFLFDTPLDISGYTASLNLLAGCTYNNMSFFKSTGLNQSTEIIPRSWLAALYADQSQIPANIVDWEYWYDDNGTLTSPNKWKDVYVFGEDQQFNLTPREIYKTYMGTNIVTIDDNTGISFVSDTFSMFADQTWLSLVNKPA